MKYLVVLFVLAGVAFTSVSSVYAESIQPGELIKASTPAVYYFSDGKRYVFPTEAVYMSWYDNFDGVKTVSDEMLASLPLGGNVTFQPGTLIKITTDPKVYLVENGIVLRWIETEEVAKQFYGDEWAGRVRDVSDASFIDYRMGESITSAESMWAGLLPSAYYSYQRVLDQIAEDEFSNGRIGGKEYDDYVHPENADLIRLTPIGYEATSTASIEELRAWFIDASSDWKLLYDEGSQTASATIQVLNFSKKTGDWFVHRSVIISDISLFEGREIELNEMEYPVEYIVYPYGATALYEAGSTDINHAIYTYKSQDEVMDWYKSAGAEYNWSAFEEGGDPLGLSVSYTTQRSDIERMLRVRFLTVEELPIVAPLRMFSVDYLKVIQQ